MTQRLRSLSQPLVAIAIVIASLFACAQYTSIDGTRVPKVTQSSPEACGGLCRRLDALCGYPPVDCVRTCEVDYDDLHRRCVGQASSCQEALQVCANEAADAGEDEGGDDGGDTDGAGEAGDDDASSAGDAKPDG
jgi:hypothetical protein